MDVKLNAKSGKNAGSKQKKPVRFLTKKGINLAADYDARSKTTTTLIAGLAVIVAVLAIGKFGVIDLYAKQSAAEASYSAAKAQDDAILAELADYDEVLLEYRTYSMDWMENDTSGKYVSVDRQEILDMVESKMMTKGTVTSVNVNGDTVEVEMEGMDLKQISDMCGDLEEVEFVVSATLETATTLDEAGADVEDEYDDEDEDEEASPVSKKSDKQDEKASDEDAQVDNLSFLIAIELRTNTVETAEAEG